MKVVIIEPSEMVFLRMKENISAIDGVEVFGIDGNSLLEMIHSQQIFPDILIIDMASTNGKFEMFLSEVKRVNPKVKIIAVNKFNCSSQYQQKALDAGADFFFEKMDAIDKIDAFIRKLLME